MRKKFLICSLWLTLNATATCFAQSLGSALVSADMSEKQRNHIMAPYFSPAPGTIVEVDPQEVINRGKKNPLKLRGYIRVTPPKGKCFVVNRLDRSEEEVCRPTTLSFKVEEIDEAGRIAWNIISGKGDIGSLYYWQTPHRIASIIRNGTDPKTMTQLSDKVPIQYCQIQDAPKGKKITLKIMDGSSWSINFPTEHKLIQPQPEPYPNLYIARESVSGGISAESKINASAEYKMDAIKGKPGDAITKHWAIPVRNSFSLNASDFVTESSAPGMKGTCRYQLKGAPHDMQSGWIECHETDSFDVVFTHLSCSAEL